MLDWTPALFDGNLPSIRYAGAEARLSEDVLDRIDQIVPPGFDVGRNEANYMPPALVRPELRRRPAGERAAA